MSVDDCTIHRERDNLQHSPLYIASIVTLELRLLVHVYYQYA